MKPLFALALSVLLALAAGCASTKAKTYSVRDVERAFFQAGVPFQGELRPPPPNPYLRPPNGTNTGPFTQMGGGIKHLQAILAAANAVTYNSVYAYVLDSKADADAALKAGEFKHGPPAVLAQRQNVVVLYVPYQGAKFGQRVRKALAALR